MSSEERFSVFENPRHIWAVPAIHGEVERLARLHREIAPQFRPGDRLIYLGNYGGESGQATLLTINELLLFRRYILAIPGVMADDIVFLRGTQEEIWHKLLQLQMAPSPASILEWMQKHGIAGMLEAYGSSLDEGLRSAREGVISLTRWTGRLRENVRTQPGHEKFFTVLRRAALSADDRSGQNLLFVHAGFDADRPLEKQGDSFWWKARNFNDLQHPYDCFSYVIRGFDPERNGMRINPVTMTLDDGCGFGGNLVAAQIASNGAIAGMLKA